ncbi:MAG: AraC family transcriptional regulator [Eubacteriales bacterium]
MKIEKIDIIYDKKGALCASDWDGLRHVKELPYLSVVQSVQGHYRIQIDEGDTFLTEEKGIFIAPPNHKQTIVHHANQHSGQMQARWVFVDVLINGTYKLEDLFEFPVIVPGGDAFSVFGGCFDELFGAVDRCDTMIAYYKLLKALLRIVTPKELLHPSVQTVLDYLRQNYGHPITIKELAGVVYLSHSHLYRLFRRSVGLSPIEYLNKYRLTVAAGLLVSTRESVSSIAKKVGMDNQFYFSKLFKRKYGIPPTQYRKTFS